MKKWLKYTGYVLLAALVIIQFFRGEKPPVTTENPGDIHTELEISAPVSNLLKAACYDCHSNETRYPWYANVAPISWLVIHDTEEGRAELNFSEWSTFSDRRKKRKLEEIVEEVKSGNMPMPIYTITHADAKLSEAQVEELLAWAQARFDEME